MECLHFLLLLVTAVDISFPHLFFRQMRFPLYDGEASKICGPKNVTENARAEKDVKKKQQQYISIIGT
jgi:hypothetical protein